MKNEKTSSWKVKANGQQKKGGRTSRNYPEGINTPGKQALFDNFGKNIELTQKIDKAIQSNKLAAWVGDDAKEKILLRGLSRELGINDKNVLIAYLTLAQKHQEYHWSQL